MLLLCIIVCRLYGDRMRRVARFAPGVVRCDTAHAHLGTTRGGYSSDLRAVSARSDFLLSALDQWRQRTTATLHCGGGLEPRARGLRGDSEVGESAATVAIVIGRPRCPALSVGSICPCDATMGRAGLDLHAARRGPLRRSELEAASSESWRALSQGDSSRTVLASDTSRPLYAHGRFGNARDRDGRGGGGAG